MGGLAYQVVSTPFVGGVETKLTAHQVPATNLLQMINMVMLKKGAIQTRDGSVELTTSPLNDVAILGWRKALMTGAYNQELFLSGAVNSTSLSADYGSWAQYSMGTNADEWVQKGTKQPLQLSETGIVGNAFDHQAADSDTCLGITVFAYEETSATQTVNLSATIIDESTGVILASNVLVQAGGSNPRVVAQAASGTISIVFCGEAGDLRISTITVPTLPAHPFGLTAQVFPAPDAGVINYFEARSVPTGGASPYIAVALYTGHVTSPVYAAGVWLLGWNPASSTVLIAPAQVSNVSYSSTFVGMWLLGSHVLISQRLAAALNFYWYSTALVAGSTATINTTGTPIWNITAAIQNRSGGARAQIFYEVPVLNQIQSTLITLGGALVGASGVKQVGCSLAGDAFNFGLTNDTPYVPIVYVNNNNEKSLLTPATEPIQPTYFLMDGGPYSASTAVTGNSSIQARYQAQNAGGATAYVKVPNVALAPNGSMFLASLPRNSNSTATYDNEFEQFRSIYRVNFVQGNPPISTVLGANLTMTGGLMVDYDGVQVVENSFNVFPEAPNVLGCPISVIRTTAGVPAAGTGTAEVTQVTFPPPAENAVGTIVGTGWMLQPGSWFTFFTQLLTGTGTEAIEPFYCWFSVDGVGSDPAFSSATAIAVPVFSTDTDLVICIKVALSINQAMGATDPAAYATVIGQASAAPISGACAVEITNIAVPFSGGTYPGLPSSVSDMFGCLPILNASNVAVATLLTCPSGLRIMPGGYFIVPCENGSAYAFYFTVDSVGQAPASINWLAASGTVSAVPIAITSADTPQLVQAAVLTALNSKSGSLTFTVPSPFSSWSVVAPWIVVSWNNTSGYKTAYNQNASGWAIEANQGGSIATSGALNACPPGNGTQSLWTFQVTFENYDGQLQLHRSAPSLPAPCVVNGAFQGNVNGQPTGGCLPRFWNPVTGVSSLGMTSLTDKNNTQLVVYRTLINESVYYRTSSPLVVTGEIDTPFTTFLPVGPMLNNPSAGFAYWDTTTYPSGFFDVSPDADVAGNPTLYTGSSYANQPPPPASFVTAHRGRLWLINAEQPNQLWYSQTFVPGSQQAPGFNSLLSLSIPQDGGNCIGLCSMDDKLVILCQTAVYYVQGDGPNALGLYSNFSAPTVLTTDAGCVSPYSVKLFSDGVVFQSAKGIYLAGRDLSAGYLGAPVESFVQGHTVTSAVLMPDRNERRFGLSNGNIVVYQDLFKQWYVIYGWSPTATLWQGFYVYMDDYGNPWQESASATTDGETPISWTVQTSWRDYSGLQGYQRVSRFLILGSSANTITATASFNYGALTDPPYTYTPNPANPEQARFWIGQQLCESISLIFTGTGTQMLEDLSLEFGGVKGIMRLGPAQTGTGG